MLSPLAFRVLILQTLQVKSEPYFVSVWRSSCSMYIILFLTEKYWAWTTLKIKYFSLKKELCSMLEKFNFFFVKQNFAVIFK